MDNLSNAIKLATIVHDGQTDKAGEPYILHPIRVMLKMGTELERICAVLHDVLEDGDPSLVDVQAISDVDGVCEVLLSLTHRPNEPYMDYIKRLAGSPVARKIKIADLEDNMNVKRLEKLDPTVRARLSRKYSNAFLYLLSKNGIEADNENS